MYRSQDPVTQLSSQSPSQPSVLQDPVSQDPMDLLILAAANAKQEMERSPSEPPRRVPLPRRPAQGCFASAFPQAGAHAPALRSVPAQPIAASSIPPEIAIADGYHRIGILGTVK